MTDESKTSEELREEHGAEEVDPGQTMAQATADQMEKALDPDETVNDRLEPQEPAEADERSEYNNPDRNVEGYEYDAPGEKTRGTYTVVDVTGETHEIARKEDRGGGVIVLITIEGAEMIPHPSGGVQQYNEELHGGGRNENEGDTVANDSEAGDPPGPADLSQPTEAALAAEKQDEVLGIDRSGDTDLHDPTGEGPAPVEDSDEAPQPHTPELTSPPVGPTDRGNVNPGPDEANLGETNADETSAGAASEQPADVNEAGDGFEDGVMGGADGPMEPEAPEADWEATSEAEELAEEKGVDLSEIKGSGQDGRILKSDVEAALKNDEAEG